MKLHLTYPDGSQQEKTLTDICSESPYTLLYFYPKDDTPGCTIQAQDFSRLYKDFCDLGIQIIGVSKDPHTSHCAFMNKYAIPYPLVSDPDFALHEMFQTVGIKSMYGKQYRGTIRSTVLLNAQGKTMARRDNVSASGHAETVLAYRKDHHHK
ncbi:MAG: peroxiredoxin [Candidatus Absconditabacterales bacterium]|nr:peroxiredoxin [Candidatus Absconditabacterales bacterium]